jgi:hypothetical protein
MPVDEEDAFFYRSERYFMRLYRDMHLRLVDYFRPYTTDPIRVLRVKARRLVRYHRDMALYYRLMQRFLLEEQRGGNPVHPPMPVQPQMYGFYFYF